MNTLQKMSTFAGRVTLKDFRTIFGLPQKALIPILEISQSKCSRMENEEKELSPDQLEKIVKALGINSEDLLKHEGNLVVVGNNFKQIKEINYKGAMDDEEKQLYTTMIEELKQENRELKNINEKFLEQIQRLFGMLEVKYQTIMA